MNEQILAAAVSRLSSLGELETIFNPDLTGKTKSIVFSVKLDGVQMEIEAVNHPKEELIFWNDANQVSEKAWAEALDEWEKENE